MFRLPSFVCSALQSLFLSFSFFIMSVAASDGGASASALRSADRSKDTCTDTLDPLMDFIRKNCDCLNSQRLANTKMNGDMASLWGVKFRRNRYKAVGVCEKRWWHWGNRSASICCCVLHGVDTPFMLFLEEVEYEKVLGQLIAATQ